MTDKPKTLSEQLTKLANRAHKAAAFHNFHGDSRARDEFANLSADLRALAEHVKGKVIASVQPGRAVAPIGQPTERYHVWIKGWGEEAYGDTLEEAIANLQSLLDQQKG